MDCIRVVIQCHQMEAGDLSLLRGNVSRIKVAGFVGRDNAHLTLRLSKGTLEPSWRLPDLWGRVGLDHGHVRDCSETDMQTA